MGAKDEPWPTDKRRRRSAPADYGNGEASLFLDIDAELERARYADAALRRLRDMLGFAASAGRENEPRVEPPDPLSHACVATSWAPLVGGSGVIDLNERRRNRAERALAEVGLMHQGVAGFIVTETPPAQSRAQRAPSRSTTVL